MKLDTTCYKRVPLHRGRPVVWGEGPEDASVVYIGEAPGSEEQIRKRPFVGDAGILLNKAFKKTGFVRKELYITNTVKHQPPENRDPGKKEIDAYLPILEKEIQTIDPDLIILSGSVAGIPFFPYKKVGAYRGYFHDIEFAGKMRKVAITYHPAAFLHGNPLWKIYLQDLKKYKSFLDGEYEEDTTNVIVADTLVDAYNVLDLMASSDLYSFDLETTGFNFINKEILCFSFTDEEGMAYVIPLWDQDQKIFDGKNRTALLSKIQELFLTPGNPFIAWNGQFDINFLYELLGFENYPKILDNWFADPMLMHHLLEEETPHSLEYAAGQYLSFPPWFMPVEHYKKEHKIKSYKDIPGHILWPYAGTDVDATLRLFNLFLPRLHEEGLMDFYFEHQHRMACVFSKMAYRGVPIDRQYLEQLRERYEIELADIMQRVFEAAGEEFNPNSWQQKGVILYDKLGLPEVARRTPSGGRSTGKATLEILAKQHEVPKLLLEHASMAKWVNSYLGDSGKTLYSNVDEDDYCRCNWLLHGTETGRCSSANPNLTNLPREGGFREAVKAPEGWVIIEADYSQAEFRYAAYRSGEKAIIRDLDAGFDGHQSTAAAVFGIPVEEVTAKQRDIGKTTNFLIQYGGGPQKLADAAGISVEQAVRTIRKFFRRRKALKKWMESVGRQALTPGIRRVLNAYGRIRHLPIGFTKEARAHIIREAVNYDPQGGVADTLWRSMYLLDEWFEENNMRAYFLVALHDGLYILCPEEEVDVVVPKVEEIMTMSLPEINAPLPVDIKITERWESKE
jgi:DNA polymerase-1